MSSEWIETSKRTVGLIWTQTRDGVLGADGHIPWDLPEYRQHVLDTVSDSALVIGRKTWAALPELFGPLPHNRKIVLTRDPDWFADGAERAGSLDEALALTDPQEVWVLGGAETFSGALDVATVIAVTEVQSEYPGDAHAPVIPADRFMMTYTIGNRRSGNGRDDFVLRSYARK
ncbi:dihydrofolate reductase [Nocardia sp. NPDC003482]